MTIVPFSIADGKEAIEYVRRHCIEYGVDSSRIGIIGFSAGGTVAMSSAYNYDKLSRPDFVASIYGFMPASIQDSIKVDAPPLFLATASNDGLINASQSVDIYSKWLSAKKKVELHIYQSGNHGFGMHKQNIPTDNWIERFSEWLKLNLFLNE
jgi:acetyl esterase/lipase